MLRQQGVYRVARATNITHEHNFWHLRRRNIVGAHEVVYVDDGLVTSPIVWGPMILLVFACASLTSHSYWRSDKWFQFCKIDISFRAIATDGFWPNCAVNQSPSLLLRLLDNISHNAPGVMHDFWTVAPIFPKMDFKFSLVYLLLWSSEIRWFTSSNLEQWKSLLMN